MRLKAKFSGISDVTFSADGRWVAAYCKSGFYQNANYKGGIWVFRPDGSALQQVTRNEPIQRKDADDRELRWLPDGYQIAFRTRTKVFDVKLGYSGSK